MDKQDFNRPIWNLSVKEFMEMQQMQIEEIVTRCLKKQDNKAISDSPLNITEAAAYLKISKDALYQLTSKRLVPFLKSGKRNFFTKELLDNWIASKRQKTISELELEVNQSMSSKKLKRNEYGKHKNKNRA